MSLFLAIVGAWASITVTVKVELTVLPPLSVAVQVTRVEPTGNTLPEAGLQTTLTPGQLSIAAGAVN